MRTRRRLLVLGGGLLAGIVAGSIRGNPPLDTMARPDRVSASLEEKPWRTTPRPYGTKLYSTDRVGVHTSGSVDDPMSPLSPTYDPIFSHQASGRSLGEIFEDEPVDEIWAKEMSKITNTHFEYEAQLLGADLEVETIECRTGTCKVVLAGQEDELFKLNGPWLSSFSEMTTFSSGPEFDDGLSRYYLYLGFSNDRRDPDAHQRWHARNRQKLIEILRRRGTLPKGIDDE